MDRTTTDDGPVKKPCEMCRGTGVLNVADVECPWCGGNGFVWHTPTVEERLAALRADVDRLASLVAALLGLDEGEMMRRP